MNEEKSNVDSTTVPANGTKLWAMDFACEIINVRIQLNSAQLISSP